MSVRPTQTESGYPRRSRQPYPSPEELPAGDPAPAGGPVEAAALAAPRVAPPEPASRLQRRAERGARRSRHSLALACGLLVAVCLVLTILIVNMARNRPAGLGPVPPSRPAALGPPASPVHSSTLTTHQTRDASASEGGTR